ncbi:MAG TPA: choice-of-anchor R domain-containing protein [Acidobacteriaceae bacterium]|nr:choice-of-anchor R domain-containing protein [Acidobacteriaceae bacterium]
MRVRVFGVLASVAAGLMLVGSAGQMRADTVFSNFGPSQTYVGNAWWNVGNSTSPAGTQVDAFSFAPSETATVTGADLALALVPPPGTVQTLTPLTVYIESNSGGTPGAILATLTQNGSYAYYPTTTVVNFNCSGSCATLDAGSTYWLVAQQTDSANTTGWLYSFGDTGTWYYNELGSATGPWTAATQGDNFSAFDVTGTPTNSVSPVPEPGTLALLALGLVGVVAIERRRALKGLTLCARSAR